MHVLYARCIKRKCVTNSILVYLMALMGELDMEYVIQIHKTDGQNSILGSRLHANFSELGIYSGKAEFTSKVKGNGILSIN